ncbi:hypothetical protein ASC97_30740 [Rhizobium sp. Root1203]|uniref:acyl-CoA thioester hydrolase/BAAT C-terminal domain-containing protein n=1 Tax=Rhizobium sp. Root1203 TaxID=1736427 RepID=UPI000710BF15|nr:acyl-CoA thioester hydrolase/BAAT C-terminal domain-containing protein [Rhizobium sp. Root1203]KQV17091.1 hypothetical protein ASC97_30740 [Rhizobium sp. Root1203]
MSTPEIEQIDSQVKGAFIPARHGRETGVIVLSGSSSRVDTHRAALFAKAGANALALRWFGAVGQSPGNGLISYRPLFEQSLTANPEAVQRAQIPIEKTAADIVLVAGGDDALWPSDMFAQQLSRRRKEYGMPVSLVVDRQAGHRILLPGENTPRSTLHAHGGSDEADARLGEAAWRKIMTLL